MSNKQKGKAWFEVIWNQGDLDRLSEFVHPKVRVSHFGIDAIDVNNIEELRASLETSLEQIGDVHFDVLDIREVHNVTVSHFRCTGALKNGGKMDFEGLAWGEWQDGLMISGQNAFDPKEIPN